MKMKSPWFSARCSLLESAGFAGVNAREDLCTAVIAVLSGMLPRVAAEPCARPPVVDDALVSATGALAADGGAAVGSSNFRFLLQQLRERGVRCGQCNGGRGRTGGGG